jgi:uncharacterized membrane protein (UPF0127 family)
MKDLDLYAIPAVIVLLVIGVAFVTVFNAPAANAIILQTSQGNVTISIEVADSHAERQVGLMYRESLDESKGMLFIFPYPEVVSFWMKNTKIALDMMFINESMDIVNIARGAQPCTNDPCETFSSAGPVTYVLEVNAGFCDARGIKEGDRIYLVVENKNV